MNKNAETRIKLLMKYIFAGCRNFILKDVGSDELLLIQWTSLAVETYDIKKKHVQYILYNHFCKGYHPVTILNGWQYLKSVLS